MDSKLNDKEISVAIREQEQENLQTPSPAKADQGFFSWIRDEEAKEKPISKAKTIPWAGIAALAGSAVTAVLSLAVLLVVNNREVWPSTGIYKFMQPASWLSAFISANSILLHIALTQGVTVAWWYKATRTQTTVGDLHKAWATGTSASSAIGQLRGLDYISLATLFVAVIPLNGFLLQGALSTPIRVLHKSVKIPVPMVQQLELGYSAYTTSAQSGLGSNSDTFWPFVFQQVQNTAGSLYSQYAYFGDKNDRLGENTHLNHLYHNDTKSIWQTRLPGAGFEYTCTESTVDYDILPRDNSTVTAVIFNSEFLFNMSEPNTLHLNMWWKANSDCVGQYEVRNCTLKAATVEYPVQVQLNVSRAYAGPYYSLQPQTTRFDDKVVKVLPVYDKEGVENSTYGGIWLSFNDWFGASITLEDYSSADGGLVSPLGQLASGIGVMHTDWSDYGFACNLSMEYGIENIGYFQALNSPKATANVDAGWQASFIKQDLANMVLEQVRQSMFLASIYSGSQWYSKNYVPWQRTFVNDDGLTNWTLPFDDNQGYYVQNAEATRLRVVAVYDVRWYMWGASIALTYLIILVILPTFWGFWVLRRKPTMSPVDMARAFSAPAVTSQEQHLHMPVNKLLKEVGSKRLHEV